MCLVSEVSHYLGLNLEKNNNNSSEGKKFIFFRNNASWRTFRESFKKIYREHFF